MPRASPRPNLPTLSLRCPLTRLRGAAPKQAELLECHQKNGTCRAQRSLMLPRAGRMGEDRKPPTVQTCRRPASRRSHHSGLTTLAE